MYVYLDLCRLVLNILLLLKILKFPLLPLLGNADMQIIPSKASYLPSPIPKKRGFRNSRPKDWGSAALVRAND